MPAWIIEMSSAAIEPVHLDGILATVRGDDRTQVRRRHLGGRRSRRGRCGTVAERSTAELAGPGRALVRMRMGVLVRGFADR